MKPLQGLPLLLYWISLAAPCNCFTVLPFKPATVGAKRILDFRRFATESVSALRERLRFDDRFSRWRYLQRILDEECEAEDTNKILFNVLDGYRKFPRPEIEVSADTSSPELTAERRQVVEQLLEGMEETRSIPALVDIGEEITQENEATVEQLKRLLPDPVEEEDADKSLWEIMMDLHGREMVKVNEKSGEKDWKARSVVARVLLHYDFLNYGLLDSPIDEDKDY